MHSGIKRCAAAVIVPALLLIPVTIFAQETVQFTDSERESSKRIIEEVIVTARKRGAQSLQDTSLSIAVVDSDQIDLRQLVGMDDYLRTIPGVNYVDTADPQFDRPAVSVYINDTPLTGLGNFGYSSPDVKLVDVNRVEVVRGPQGTLYGDGSMGGTVRIIPQLPDVERFAGSINGSFSNTDGAGGDNHKLEGMINIPLAEHQFAIRAAVYRHDDSGYYRNIAASDPQKSFFAGLFGGIVEDRDDVGNYTYTGGRISALWLPSDNLSINFSFLTQEIEQDGRAFTDTALQPFEQKSYLQFGTREPENLSDDLDVTSLTIDYDFGALKLTSATSWADYSAVDDLDAGPFLISNFGADVPIFFTNFLDHLDSFTQEIRLSSSWDKPFQFLVGAYYHDRDWVDGQLLFWAGDPAMDIFGGASLVDTTFTKTLEQTAVFGEASYAFSEQWTGTLGMRYYDYDISTHRDSQGLFIGGRFIETIASTTDGETFKLDIAYTPNDETMVYARWAEGFRLGLPLGELSTLCDLDMDGLVDGLGLPAQDQVFPDELESWEIGSKLSLAGGRVQLRGSAYYLDWTGIPVSLVLDCGFIRPFNAGEAKSVGFEFEGNAVLTDQLRMDFSAGYVDAELTADAPGIGSRGERLPGIAKYNLSVGLQYDFLKSQRPAYVRADLATVGDFYNNLQGRAPKLGDYTTFNISTGMTFGNIEASFFINNLTDEDAFTWVDSRPQLENGYALRPRTVGVNFRYSFSGE
jgi:outer membrane receptor protein involved in Fe transport